MGVVAHLLRGRDQDILHQGPLLVEGGVELVLVALLLGERLYFVSTDKRSKPQQDKNELFHR